MHNNLSPLPWSLGRMWAPFLKHLILILQHEGIIPTLDLELLEVYGPRGVPNKTQSSHARGLL
jgi:hypothetical protein